MKINNNIYGIDSVEPIPGNFYVPSGASLETKVGCSILKTNINASGQAGAMIIV
jgi:hypothetical protein